jgi:hypothetical protein
MAMTGRHLTGERAIVEELLSWVRNIMSAALADAIRVSEVDWTEKRWDTVDITATWSQAARTGTSTAGLAGTGRPIRSGLKVRRLLSLT